MQAVLWHEYGPPEGLRLGEAPLPIPKRGEIRIRVRATTVTSGDARMRGFRDPGIFWLPLRAFLGWRRPRHPILGMEFAGHVDALGEGVTEFVPGERVFGMALLGANAEYLTIPAAGAVLATPALLSDEEAAALPFGALAALVFLRDVARWQPGERVLIHGAAGAVGVHAVQLARHFGLHVTAVCSAAAMELVRGLGAHRVLDRATEDFTRGEERYDVILDTVGGTSFRRARRVLAPGGRHVFAAFGFRELRQMLWTALRGGPRVLCGFAGSTKADLHTLRGLVEAGALRPVIGHHMALEEIVAAHRLVDSGRKRGALVLRVGAIPAGFPPRA
ncbi:NAD(P)-dependent alcohol dehydrogenase [Sediminicoccus sp. KRV36]|uniref:NAD(P)-dependent alcohol dehydrogenase n=1 Tax=Sediminicoccus sp. KRV36 TaxID=3133721 RepID=UPI00200D1FC8|nr:NAD(P)-dependent alcohol dehydrogenase [Sediminicoccus rosea]UPY37778.1 NAD(P)-dependent alcohol dehydrogenase [Sediminicoccus rosea]